MKTLLTGFNRFGSLKENSSQLVVEDLAKRAKTFVPFELITEVLPTKFIKAGERIRHLIRHHRPERIICLGVSQNLSAIHLERVALNLDDAEAADNAGLERKGDLIVPNAPLAYWSTLPIEKMCVMLRQREIPAHISNHAGAFLCNHVFYVARHEIETLQLNSPCGFIHLPGVSEKKSDGAPGLPLPLMIEAIESCLRMGS